MIEYTVPKRTLTYSDTLEAVGLASFLEEIAGTSVRILDRGDRFLLQVRNGMPDPDKWPVIEPGYPFIYLAVDGEKPIGSVLDYAREKDKAEQLRKFRNATGKNRERIVRVLREQGLTEPPAPGREYRMATFLAAMRKGWQSDKHLYRWLKADPARTRRWVAHHLALDDNTDVEEPAVSNSQVFNPISGKGVHRPKPDSTAPGSIAGQLVDPFAEWLRFRGAYRVMLPYRHDGDYKVFVIEPADISVAQLAVLREKLLDLNLWGGVRLDIEATWRLVELLIRRSDVLGGTVPLLGRRPAEIVRGLHQAYFQSLGTAAALMNYSFTGLPSWFAIEHADDAADYLHIMHEHIADKRRDGITGCLRSLDPDHSGDLLVLQQYRCWLASGNLKDFGAFCLLFAQHVMERMGAKEWVKPLSVHGLDIILGRGYRMREITERQGFASVARAIRNASIYALSFQNQGRGEREVRFGLAQQWKQKMKGGKEELVAAVCDFVQQYNWESENLESAGRKAGSAPVGTRTGSYHRVTAPELAEVIQLIEDKGAELVGMLLLAYGYARLPKAQPGQAGTDVLETEIENDGGKA